MFEQLIKRQYHLKIHLNAPLYQERLEYIQYWANLGRSKHTLKAVASYLLRIVEFLQLDKRKMLTYEDIEKAAILWAQHQSNHPMKRAFSESGKERFTWYAIHWLKRINRLEASPEEKIPLFNEIFKRRKALKRHMIGPLLQERLKYLQYWSDNGAAANTLKGISQYLLIVIKCLNLDKLRMISHNEVENAANLWASQKNFKRKSEYSKTAKARFVHNALGWLEMLGCLKKTDQKPIPSEEYLQKYIEYIRNEQGLSENTIKSKIFQLKDFLININQKKKTLAQITPLCVDDALTKKFNVDGYSRISIQTYASTIRSFLRHAENQQWCKKNLAESIKAPRVYTYESLPSSPSWKDVKKLLANSKTDNPTDIRDYALLMLLSIYGMRCSEVTNLRLKDLDWKNERIYLKRAKRSKPQIFPLSIVVGKAILRYLKDVRPNNCSVKEVFICRRSPYRPLKAAAIYQIVSRRFKPLDLKIKHHGPHALRHACATHLINEGVSLKEISDHLGHQGLDTTRIYAKVDLTSLRKVAEFKMGDLI